VPRYYHDGSQLDCPAIVKHPQFGHVLRVPPAFVPTRGQFVPAKPGSIVLPLVDHGLFICEPGGFVDLPPLVVDPRLDDASREAKSDAIVKAQAPHLLTEAEAIEKGIVQPRPTVADKPSGGSGARGPKAGN
jgi:hypothetical protein